MTEEGLDWADIYAEAIMTVGDNLFRDKLAKSLRKAKAEGYTLGFNETAALILGEISKAQNGGAVPDKDELALKVTTRILEIEAGK